MNSISQNVIKHKVGLLNLAAEFGNVSRVCKVVGFSRETFYRYQSAVESGGVEALLAVGARVAFEMLPFDRPRARTAVSLHCGNTDYR